MERTLEDHVKTMTIFYSESTGKIKCVCGGFQTMDYFGDDKDDYNYTFTHVEYNEHLFYNYYRYKYIDGAILLIDEEVPQVKQL